MLPPPVISYSPPFCTSPLPLLHSTGEQGAHHLMGPWCFVAREEEEEEEEEDHRDSPARRSAGFKTPLELRSSRISC